MNEPYEEPGIAAALDNYFARWNRNDQPGLVVGIRHHGCMLYRQGFGMASLETRVANSPDTKMRIGSVTKHFLAVLALQLQEQRLFDIDAPIGTYLPELNPPNSLPTIRQLLQHRGGTRCHIELAYMGHGLFAPPEGCAFETLVSQKGVSFAPNEAMIYNNGGYHLVSLAVARIAGMPLGELMQRKLFDPLAMSSTALVPSDYVMTPGIASFHLPGDGFWRRGLFMSNETLGEGGIVSTIDDMLRWIRFLRSKDIFGHQAPYERLLDLPVEADGATGYYGLGLMERRYRGRRVFSHPGGVIGGSSDMLCVPEQELEVIIMSNGAPGALLYLMGNEILDIVLADRLGVAEPPVNAAAFAQSTGHYASNSSGMVYSLEVLGGTLCLRIAQYALPYSLENDRDGWLTTTMTGIGTIRVKSEQDAVGARTLLVDFAGKRDVFAQVASLDEADALSLPSEVEGEFHSEESGLAARIERRGGKPILAMRDKWGFADYQLLGLGGRWLRMKGYPYPDQFGATIWFREGWEGSFIINSARTRNLVFNRVRDKEAR